jgi:molybdopterin/thiamine biosynthesis adenylyltransferase
MRGYRWNEFDGVELSIAIPGRMDLQLANHLIVTPRQEGLTFAYWRPSHGKNRYTAIVSDLMLPSSGDCILQGNVAFTTAYLDRVLDSCPDGCGIALLHGHLGPGWQDMSDDDIVAEQDRLASVVAGRTGLPLVGLTLGTDGTWSGRVWLRVARYRYQRRWVTTVRSVGTRLRLSFHPELSPIPQQSAAQVATRSVWGDQAQADLARIRVGVVGLGSVGSVVAEALSRTGISHITLIDHDIIEERNLDRTLGAFSTDVAARMPKVAISQRLINESHTAPVFDVETSSSSLLSPEGMAAALDCDVIICCVDRPWPRHVLNNLAYQHLIPVIDGGILARVNERGCLLHVDWRIHTIGPEYACLYCLDALSRSDAALDRDGLLDDPDYIQGLTLAERDRYQRRNVFAFSLSVAAHEVLQLVGLVTGNRRVGGIGPQRYRAYPGTMEVTDKAYCQSNCEVAALTATAGPMIPPGTEEIVAQTEVESPITGLKSLWTAISRWWGQ